MIDVMIVIAIVVHKMELLVIACFCVLGFPEIYGLKKVLRQDDVSLEISLGNPVTFRVVQGDYEKVSGTLGEGLALQLSDDSSDTKCILESDKAKLIIQTVDDYFNFEWIADKSVQLLDCILLNSGEVNWFGGQERYYAKWPIEGLKYNGEAYRSTRIENGAVAERYWLSSEGVYIFVDDRVPLFLEQNSVYDDSLCLLAKKGLPYANREKVLLNYTLAVEADAREAHKHALAKFLGKPTEIPNEHIIKSPIWTTWAKYKAAINDTIVLSFAQDIVDHGFNGQLEIDDAWETCYGTIIFNDQFSEINTTVATLKKLGFTVTLWTHPFVNDECTETTKEGREKGYFVKDTSGNDTTSWWNGNNAHHIDFTNPEAANWYVNRLKLIQEKHGIDSFKFDAGENDWAPEVAQLTGDVELIPNSLTEAYLRTVAQFGDLIEVRSASRTQDLPMFVRVLDKDSRWGLDNGLHNLITTLLQMNLNGYPLVLPDMIGGNGYATDLPTAELLVRWTQANVFMPSMQFSFLPWELPSDDFDTLAIVKKFVDLHAANSELIIEAMKNSVENGTPVNGLIWWLDPTNREALKVSDEFLLGEKILVAPVIVEGARSRNIVLPAGSWKDGNNGSIYDGPTTLSDYPAPIDVLPYFIKQ